MRALQSIAFLLGIAAFVAAAAFTGRDLGDTFWKTGLAFMSADVVLILLYPTGRLAGATRAAADPAPRPLNPEP